MKAEILFFPIILTDINLPWEKVLSQGTPVSLPPKSILSGQFLEPSRAGMYYIKRGRIRLSNIAPNGQEKVLLYMGKGMLFSEIPMVQFAADCLFTVMEKTDAVFLPRNRLLTEEFARKHPDLLFNMVESLCQKAQNFFSQLCSLRTFDAFTNICRALYSMHLYHRVRGTVVPQLTQQELAAFLGIHRSSLHKGLVRLKDEGIIGPYNRKELSIHDHERLHAYALAFE